MKTKHRCNTGELVGVGKLLMADGDRIVTYKFTCTEVIASVPGMKPQVVRTFCEADDLGLQDGHGLVLDGFHDLRLHNGERWKVQKLGTKWRRMPD